MMTDPKLRAARIAGMLAPAPAAIRQAMLDDAASLPPGAAAVVGRFFAILTARGEPLDAPSRASFDAAAASEPTLATLLRALTRYAPMVGTNAGREARASWYWLRSGGKGRRRGESPLPASAPTIWPEPWRPGYGGLLTAQMEDSSRRTFRRQMTACARTCTRIGARPVFDRWTAYLLFEAFEAEGKRPATVANYLYAFMLLARLCGADPKDVAGIGGMQAHAQAGASAVDALKVARVDALHAKGGYEHVVATIRERCDEADAAPAWTSAAETARRAAAVLVIVLNVPPRTGDMSRWRYGRDLVRTDSGAWRLRWTQQKNRKKSDMGTLWPEIWPLLDAWLLRGAPHRFAALEYRRLVGMNWLTRQPEDPQGRLASTIVADAIGYPLHDLRTLAADYLLDADPETAPNVITTLLGHRCAASSAPYRASATGRAATEAWREMRQAIGAEHKPGPRTQGFGQIRVDP